MDTLVFKKSKAGTEGRKAFNMAAFIAAPVNTDDPRRYMNYVWVESGRAWATDGHRLHYVDGTGLADGKYSVIKRTATRIELQPTNMFADLEPPKVARLIDNADGQVRNEVKVEGGAWHEDTYMGVLFTIMRQGVCVNPDYIGDILNEDTDAWTVKLALDNKGNADQYKAIVIENCVYKAILMPIKV